MRIRLPGLLLALFLGLFMGMAQAANQDGADAAVADILFDYDGSSEFASYVIDDVGNVDITLAVDMPDELYIEIVDRLRDHPDIGGVLAGKTGAACGLF